MIQVRSSTLTDCMLPLSVVSRSRLFCDGLVLQLSAYAAVHLVESYSGESPGVAPAPNPPGHIVLLDAGLGADAVVAWIRYWRGLQPPAVVIVLDLPNDSNLILACIQGGAGGCTLRGADGAELAEAVARAHDGAAYCSPEITEQLFKHLAEHAAAPAAPSSLLITLSPREIEILRCIADDLSNQQIADLLVLQLCTVKHHVHNILEKLRLRTRWEAVRLATERGWLEPDSSVRAPRSPAV